MALNNDFTQFFKPWFSGTPTNAKKASVEIGAGTNGVITTTYDTLGTDGNSYTLEVVTGVGNNIALSAVLTGTAIVVTLGTGAGGSLDNAKNTALLIAAAIDGISGFTSEASGTGATAFTEAIDETAFEGGVFATPAKTAGFIVLSGTWYIATKPVDKFTTDGWKSASPSLI